MSISDLSLSQPRLELTSKQQTILDALSLVISQEGIEVYLDTAPSEFGSPISVDVEHDECGNMVCIGVYDGIAARCYTRIDAPLKLRLETEKFIMHNGVSDMEMLRFWGINVRDAQLVWDTLLIGHLLDSSLKSYGLKDMAKRELGISYPSYSDITGKHKIKCKATNECSCTRLTLDKQPIEVVSAYNALDTYCTWRLYESQKRALV